METNFVINDFEGPLDLLLHLIKTSKMDIYDIRIEEITKQYVDFINKMKEMNLTVASEYLVMASELIELKSRMLLPKTEEEEEEDPREDLVNRLIEFQKYKDMISSFKELEKERKDLFTRDPINYNELSDNHIENDGTISLDDLVNALSKFLERKELEKPISTKITKKEITVQERTRDIRNILSKKKKVSFFDLFEVKTKEYVVVTFLTILEMAKFGEIEIIQENNFNNIIINKKEGFKMTRTIEALLFAVGSEGLSLEELTNILEKDADDILKDLDKLNEKYKSEESGIELKLLGNSYKLTTKESEVEYLKKLATETSNNLTEAALETLAIIAYNEPITRVQIDEIRGINSSNMIRNLIAKGPIENSGKSDLPGRPNLYKTTPFFLDYFNLSNINELPEIEEEVEVLEDDDLYKSRYSEESL